MVLGRIFFLSVSHVALSASSLLLLPPLLIVIPVPLGFIHQGELPTKHLIMSDDQAIKQLESALALQKKAFLKNQCPSVEERKANIGKIPGMVLTNRDAIREAMTKDFGSHPSAITDMVEVLGVAGRAAYVLSKLDEWTKEERREVDPQLFGASKGEVRYQPKGVIGNIVRMYTTST